uniref:Uncharacterized protein n=1 Tax=Rhizophora mucronata TaxID=61149 RepID=A0A2P2IZ38_RHIMU
MPLPFYFPDTNLLNATI